MSVVLYAVLGPPHPSASELYLLMVSLNIVVPEEMYEGVIKALECRLVRSKSRDKRGFNEGELMWGMEQNFISLTRSFSPARPPTNISWLAPSLGQSNLYQFFSQHYYLSFNTLLVTGWHIWEWAELCSSRLLSPPMQGDFAHETCSTWATTQRLMASSKTARTVNFVSPTSTFFTHQALTFHGLHPPLARVVCTSSSLNNTIRLLIR